MTKRVGTWPWVSLDGNANSIATFQLTDVDWAPGKQTKPASLFISGVNSSHGALSPLERSLPNSLPYWSVLVSLKSGRPCIRANLAMACGGISYPLKSKNAPDMHPRGESFLSCKPTSILSSLFPSDTPLRIIATAATKGPSNGTTVLFRSRHASFTK